MGTSLAILTSVYPACDRGRVLGINTAAVYSGLSLGPVLGGFLTQNFGWRSLFLVMLPVGIPALVLGLARLPDEPAESRRERFDMPGTVLFGAGLAALMIGFSRLPRFPASFSSFWAWWISRCLFCGRRGPKRLSWISVFSGRTGSLPFPTRPPLSTTAPPRPSPSS